MKILHLHTLAAVMSAGMTSAFHSDDSYQGKKSKIQYLPEMRAYLIDGKTIIHEHQIREVVIELQETVKVKK